jgi:hypothetical protein
MNKNQRKNRPRKKEIPTEKWEDDLENIKRQYEYGGGHGREKQEEQSSSKHQAEE